MKRPDVELNAFSFSNDGSGTLEHLFELAVLMQFRRFVAASDALAGDKNPRDGPRSRQDVHVVLYFAGVTVALQVPRHLELIRNVVRIEDFLKVKKKHGLGGECSTTSLTLTVLQKGHELLATTKTL